MEQLNVWSHLLTFHGRSISGVWMSILLSLSHININNAAHLLHSIPFHHIFVTYLAPHRKFQIERAIHRRKRAVHTSHRASISKQTLETWSRRSCSCCKLISDQQNQQQPKYKFNMWPNVSPFLFGVCSLAIENYRLQNSISCAYSLSTFIFVNFSSVTKAKLVFHGIKMVFCWARCVIYIKTS